MAVLLPLVALGQDTWSWQHDPAPGPLGDRYGQAIVWTGDEVIVWGGRRVEDGFLQEAVNTGARYNHRTRTWTPMSVVGAPSPRTDGSTVWTGRELIVWGGYANNATLGDGARYNPKTDQWTPISSFQAPFQRYHHSTLWTGSELIVWGGSYFFGGDSGGTLNDGGRYDPQADTWRPIPAGADVPLARDQASVVWTGAEMLLFGGEYLGGSMFELKFYPYNDLWSYQPKTGTWELLSTEGPGYRTRSAAAWTGSELLVWGGRGGVPLIEGWILNPVYLLADGWRYSTSSRSWRPMATTDQPGKRAEAVTLWTGAELLVFGGSTDPAVTPERTGGRYDPATDRWITMNTNGAPRFPESAVWTGSRVLSYAGSALNPPTHDTMYTYRPPSIYEGDSLPDDWQQQFFGEENPAGLPGADPDQDGQNNEAEFMAGTNPTDPQSRLRLSIEWVADSLSIKFSPYRSDRTYTLEDRSSLTTGSFEPATDGQITDVGDTRIITLPRPIFDTLFLRLSLQAR